MPHEREQGHTRIAETIENMGECLPMVADCLNSLLSQSSPASAWPQKQGARKSRRSVTLRRQLSQSSAVPTFQPRLLTRSNSTNFTSKRSTHVISVSIRQYMFAMPRTGRCILASYPPCTVQKIRLISAFRTAPHSLPGPVSRHHGVANLADLPWRSCVANVDGQNPDRPGHDVRPCASNPFSGIVMAPPHLSRNGRAKPSSPFPECVSS